MCLLKGNLQAYTRGDSWRKVRRRVALTETTLSLAAIHRIIKKEGAERVSESAAKELAKVLAS